MNNKTCTYCLELKSKDEFYNKNSRCKNCVKAISKLYRSKNKDKLKISRSRYVEKNREKLLSYWKNYRKENHERRKELRKVYEKKKLKNNISFRLRKSVRNSIYCAILRSGSKKNGSILENLPYTIDELKKHLESLFESWMTWDNWGVYNPATWDENDQSTWTWQIDHIILQSDLKYDSFDHPNFKKCWSLDNLRPYSSKKNILEVKTRLI